MNAPAATLAAVDELVAWLNDEPQPGPRPRVRRKRAKSADRRRFWTAEEDERLRREYQNTATAMLAASLGRSVGSVYQRAHGPLGLTKSAEYLASPAACRLRRGDNVGLASRFKKGQVPPNKGLRRPGWAPGRMRETQFKRGQSGHNWKPVGATRLVDGYVYRKVSDIRCVPWTRNWVPEHIRIWTEAHGPLKPGEALVFKNGDRLDVRLDNLERITRRELMQRNSVHNLPAPLPQVIQLLGALKRKIRRRERAQEQADGPSGSPLRNTGAAEGRRQAAGGGDRPCESHR